MKKLILALTVTSLSFGAFASEACCDKEKAATAGKENVAATCPASKETGKSLRIGATAGKKLTESPKGAQARKS